MLLLKVYLVCLMAKISLAKPDGAPSRSCKHMLPGHVSASGLHGIPIQHQAEATSPYIIHATWDRDYQYVTLTITGAELKGFLIQARQSGEGKPLGTFLIDENLNETKYQDCSGDHYKYAPQSSVTHVNKDMKQNLRLVWKPPSGQLPSNNSRQVKFYATIARSFKQFWLKLPSNDINLSEERTTTPPVFTVEQLETTQNPSNSSSTQLFKPQTKYIVTLSAVLLAWLPNLI